MQGVAHGFFPLIIIWHQSEGYFFNSGIPFLDVSNELMGNYKKNSLNDLMNIVVCKICKVLMQSAHSN